MQKQTFDESKAAKVAAAATMELSSTPYAGGALIWAAVQCCSGGRK
jgi:hypothetical protein